MSSNYTIMVGSTGPTGAQGDTGYTGAQGIQGPQGIQGLQGLQGNVGAQGPQGNVGPQGSQGPQGNQGLLGPTGNAGAQGLQGNPGSQGPQGSIGPQGPQGVVGPQGSIGSQGSIGPQGPQGLQGLVGPTGASFVPSYAYIYNNTAQTIPSGNPVSFSSDGYKTPDLTHSIGGDTISFLNGGLYEVHFSVSVDEPSQFVLDVNGILDDGLCYGSAGNNQQNNGFGYINALPSSYIRLINSSDSLSVTLDNSTSGTRTNVNASIKVNRVG